jgi:TolB-like protein
METFFLELKRRKVFRVAMFYAIVAWPVIEVLDIYLPTFDAPSWVYRTILLMFVLGLPVAIMLAWVFEITPEGIKTDLEAQRMGVQEPQHTRVKTDPSEPLEKLAEPTRAPPYSKSIAVLPPTNLSPDPEHAYFASGMHEEMLDQLAKIADLKVISRTAVLRYQETTLKPSEIAAELNVSTIMEGTVRFANHRVRITTQLIRASDDTHLWSETYQFELDDIFAIQFDVAKSVAKALQAKLSPIELINIERPATESTKAYTLFLQHRYQYQLERARPTLEQDGWIESGIRKMEQALVFDPKFARGLAELGWLKWYKGVISGHSVETAMFDEAIQCAHQALALDPQISRAYQVLQRVFFHRRQWSEWEHFARRSVALPDLEGSAAFNMALTLALLGQYREANYWFDVTLSKNSAFPYYWELATTTKISGSDYEGALLMVEKYRAVGGDENAYHTVRAYALMRLNRKNESLDEYRLIENKPMASVFIPQYYDYLRGQMGEATSVMIELDKLPDDFTKETRKIHCSAGADDIDSMFEAYGRVMASGRLIHYGDIVTNEIRTDSRWQAIQDYMHLPPASHS